MFEIYKQFNKIQEQKKQIAGLRGSLDAVKRDRESKIKLLEYYKQRTEDLYSVVYHWQKIAKVTFLAFAIVTVSLIYAVGTN